MPKFPVFHESLGHEGLRKLFHLPSSLKLIDLLIRRGRFLVKISTRCYNCFSGSCSCSCSRINCIWRREGERELLLVGREGLVSFLADLQPGGQGRRLVCSSHTTSRESINLSIYDWWYEAFFQSPKAERSPSASGEYYLITFDCIV